MHLPKSVPRQLQPFFTIGLLAVALGAGLRAASAASGTPNVIVILADDLGYGVVNSYGGDANRVATPNIDRLATEGARFTEGYVTASTCGPSRAALMTGRYQQRFGIYANCDTQTAGSGVPGDQTMMPRYFKQAGYATAMIGKWHLGIQRTGQHPLEKGFDEYFGFNSSQTDYFQSPILFHGREKVDTHEYLTREFTDLAIRFVERRGDAPFFLYLAYNAVHGPNQAPKETIARFARLGPREALQAAMVAELDAGVGRVLDALDKSGQARDTLIFFLSDNGGLPNWWEGSNGRLRGLKRHQFDGGNKVPFLVRWPAGVPAGQVRRQPVTALDILPTALAAAGLAAPAHDVLDGINLLPALKASRDLQPERPLFWAGSHYEGPVPPKQPGAHDNPPPAWAIRRGDWKLMQVVEQGPPLLFNLAADPSESKDVIGQHPEIAEQMRRTWVEWFQIGGTPIAWKPEYFQQLKSLR